MNYDKYTLAPDIVITTHEDKPVIHCALDHTYIITDWKVHSVIVSLLSSSKDVIEQTINLVQKDTYKQILFKLLEFNIIIDKNNVSDKYLFVNNLKREWNDWGACSWFMQVRSSNIQYPITEDERDIIGEKFFENSPPQPDYYKCICTTDSIKLPIPNKISDMSLQQSLLQRRSCRNFQKKSISQNELSNLLFYTAGQLFTHDTRFFGKVAKKTAPSPGGRHSIEIYVLINKCDNIQQGIYHYCQKHHTITLIKKVDSIEFLKEALFNQEYFLDASVSIFYTSRVQRLMWKYKNPKVYRLMHFEAGHYAQNFLLTGTAMNLGVYVTGAFNEDFVNNALAIDGVNEISLYVTGAGYQSYDGPYKRANIVKNDIYPSEFDINLPKSLKDSKDQLNLG